MARLEAKKSYSYWVPLMSARNVDAALGAVCNAGGKALLAPFDVPGRGRVAVVADPQGAAFGLLRATRGDPPDASPGLNDCLWNEVLTADTNAASRFYAGLAGYTPARATVDRVEYQYMERDGKPRMGLLTKPDPKLPNTWLATVRVADAGATAAPAPMLGGTVVLAPRPDVRNGTVAVIADPNGAGVVVQHLNN
jgi:predicted enzyme related to lactoylglutathione lyase